MITTILSPAQNNPIQQELTHGDYCIYPKTSSDGQISEIQRHKIPEHCKK